MTLVGWASGSYDKDAEPCDRNLNLQPERFCNNGQDHKTRMNFQNQRLRNYKNPCNIHKNYNTARLRITKALLLK